MPVQSQQTGDHSQINPDHAGLFHVDCDAGRRGCLRTTTDTLSIHAGQQIRRGEDLEAWNSVSIYSMHEADGSFSLRVIVFHPDWEEPIQIACLRSWPQDASGQSPSLQCDLEHKHL